MQTSVASESDVVTIPFCVNSVSSVPFQIAADVGDRHAREHTVLSAKFCCWAPPFIGLCAGSKGAAAGPVWWLGTTAGCSGGKVSWHGVASWRGMVS